MRRSGAAAAMAHACGRCTCQAAVAVIQLSRTLARWKRAACFDSVRKRREYLVTMADRVDREKILDALDKAEAAAPPAPAASEAERR